MIRTFTIYDAAKSNTIALAAFFMTTRTLVLELLGDSHDSAVTGVAASVAVHTLYEGADVVRVLSDMFYPHQDGYCLEENR